MGKIKDLVCEVENALYTELGRDPTDEELNKATEDYWQSYNEHLDDLAENHYQSMSGCSSCIKGVMHTHDIQTGYNYRGFTYSGEETCGPKTVHEVIVPRFASLADTDCKIIFEGVSPYLSPTRESFHKFVDDILKSSTCIIDMRTKLLKRRA